MNCRWLISGCLLVAVFAATVAWALCIATESPGPPGPPAVKLLFVSGGINDDWQRTVEGAQAAARDLGIELQVRTPTADGRPDQQAAILRSINFTGCDGVLFCPAAPESQLELIGEIAEQTKLVTIGNYHYPSKALSHVGFSARGMARKVANLTLSELPQGGKILMVSSRRAKATRDAIADEQLNDFKEQWAEWDTPGTSILRSVIVDVDNYGDITPPTASAVSGAIGSPDLAFIFAFDSPSVDAVLSVLKSRPQTTRIPIIAAFDHAAAVLDAVDDGRIFAAISSDSYRGGYEGVLHAAKLCRSKSGEMLPIPGYGSSFIPSEVVQKADLLSFRRRDQTRRILANRPGCSTSAIES